MTAFDHDRLDELAATLGEGARDLLLRRFLTELADRPGEIAAAADAGNHGAARDLAHYFRSAALTVGATDVAAAAKAVERAGNADISARVRAVSASAEVTRSALSRLLAAQLV